MKVIKKRCWKCKGTGEEIVWNPYHPFTCESKVCSVCRGSGRIEIKQDRIK